MRLCLTLLLLLSTTVAALASPPGLWLDSAAVAFMPHARSNLAVVSWGDGVFVLGGSGAQGASTEASLYHPFTHAFEELPPLPSPRMAHAAALCGSRLLVFGGMRDTSTWCDEILAYDLEKRVWTRAGTMPFARARFGLAVLDGRVWIAGGCDASGRYAETWVFDPKTNAFTRKADLPQARDRLSLVALDGSLWALGGEGPDGKASASCWRYNLSENTWTRMPSLARARKNCTAARLGDRIMAVGGWDVVDDEKVFVSRIEVFDPQARDWLESGRLETPRDGCRAATWRGRVLIFGGFGGETLSSVEEATWQARDSRWSLDAGLPVTLWCQRREADLPSAIEEPPALDAQGKGPVAALDAASALAHGLVAPGAAPVAQAWFGRRFPYPRQLSQETSVRRALTPFLVDRSPAWASVETRLKEPDATSVVAVVPAPASTRFDAAHPFPSLRIPTERVGGVSPQTWFDDAQTCATLYLRSSDASPQQAAQSPAAGPAAMAHELAAVLSRTYRSVNGPLAGCRYFLDDSDLDQAGDKPRVTVICMETAPTVFSDGQGRPLFPDPMHLFESAMLRLTAEDRSGIAPAAVTSLKDIGGTVERTWVLEAGSASRGR